jgi:hypothetical protein
VVRIIENVEGKIPEYCHSFFERHPMFPLILSVLLFIPKESKFHMYIVMIQHLEINRALLQQPRTCGKHWSLLGTLLEIACFCVVNGERR